MQYFGINTDQQLNTVLAELPATIDLDLENGIQRVKIKNRWFYQIRIKAFNYLDLITFCRSVAKRYGVILFHTDVIAQSKNVSKIIITFYGKHQQRLSIGYLDRSCGIFIPKHKVHSSFPTPTYDPLNLTLPTTVDTFYQAIVDLPDKERTMHVTNIIQAAITYPTELIWRNGEIAPELIRDITDHIDFQSTDSILSYLAKRDIDALAIPTTSLSQNIVEEQFLKNDDNQPTQDYLAKFPNLTGSTITSLCEFLEFLVNTKNHYNPDVLRGFFNELSKVHKNGRFFIKVGNQRVTIDYLLPPPIRSN